MLVLILIFAVILIVLSGGWLGWMGLRDRLPSTDLKARMQARQNQRETLRLAKQARKKPQENSSSSL
jgi:hypothetical protein